MLKNWQERGTGEALLPSRMEKGGEGQSDLGRDKDASQWARMHRESIMAVGNRVLGWCGFLSAMIRVNGPLGKTEVDGVGKYKMCSD
jgi:hypothetical protein